MIKEYVTWKVHPLVINGLQRGTSLKILSFNFMMFEVMFRLIIIRDYIRIKYTYLPICTLELNSKIIEANLKSNLAESKFIIRSTGA